MHVTGDVLADGRGNVVDENDLARRIDSVSPPSVKRETRFTGMLGLVAIAGSVGHELDLSSV
jgi:hypothetical protein